MARFLAGLASSFTIGSTDVVRSFLGVIFGFLVILPIAIVAIWKPKISVVLLAICLVTVEVLGFTWYGMQGILLAVEKLTYPHISLICGYAYVAWTQGQLKIPPICQKRSNQ
jgi:hypothetical protein